MYRKIVVAVDIAQLEKGERILRKASTLLDEGGTLLLLNVVEDIPGYLVSDLTVDMMVKARQESEETLIDLRARMGIAAEIEIREGSPAREILAASEERGADLIIVASHIPDLSNYFIGATADRVVRHAKCSVLIDR
ncbi:nucleotide-binding universal stress UspA family protein [Rhizobium petrolearium]|uniref:Universal stress protein n=1 Tax=Neorhizobium petrolearium TaxID=515361 RepID=A0ABY8M3U2_9HYPH|nr:universal stress protein [Neorhizobium petrolearium]MBP1843849.1 nucleotide-binding universal stress UspA family protein [Neorhizobium petrolearium]MCC2608978.1 universal stress protein [Neorhizobium petrolearium]WGI69220.1 universal stress protein [Neorhizobium petrolearium]